MIRNRWWVVVASFMAQLVGSGAINVFAFSVLLKPIAKDLGLGRGALSSALLLSTLLTAVGCLSFGRLLDRGQIRATLLPAIALFAVSVAALYLLRPSLVVVYILFGLSGFFGTGQTPLAYAKVIAQWFNKERGLGLGIMHAGIGFGGLVVTQLARLLVSDFGWRRACLGLGIAIFLIAFMPVAIFVREPDSARLAPPTTPRALQQNRVVPGLTAAEALKGSWQFWKLALAFFLVVLTLNGPLIHAVALLTDRGISLSTATAGLSAAGLAMIVGGILSGYLLDRFFGPHVAICCVAVAMAGIGFLGIGAGVLIPTIGAVLCGFANGAVANLLPYFISRYFGLRSFGQIFGYLFAVFMISVGVGPSLLGFSFDRWHSYNPMLFAFEIALLIACMIFLLLGPYRFPALEQMRHDGENGGHSDGSFDGPGSTVTCETRDDERRVREVRD
jgi:MFS family permease